MGTADALGAVAGAGTVLIAAVFIVSGVGLIGDFPGVTALMSAKHVPQPAFLLATTILVWLAGGAGLLVAALRRHAAILLCVVLAIVTVVIHDFWAAPPPQLPNELQHFLANVAIAGGLLCVAAR